MIIEKTVGLAEESLKNKKKFKAFFGISIFNKFFTKDTFEEYAKFCSENFSETIVLLMDDVERINFRIFKKLDEKQASERAWNSGKELKQAFERRLRKNNITNLKIVLLKDLLQEIKSSAEIIRNEYTNNLEFKNKFRILMWEIIGKKIEEFLEQVNEELLDELAEFLIVELAALFYLTEKGYKIELDPTPEFSIKQDIYEGRLQELRQKLNLVSERGHIFVHPENKYYGGKNQV